VSDELVDDVGEVVVEFLDEGRSRRWSWGAKVYGHPAEWASVTCRQIADSLNEIEDDLRETLNHDPAVHPGHSEARRVALAHH
jgi:hypothetical protein